MTGNSAYLIKH